MNQTALIVWDEVPMQHCHAIESVEHTLRDLLEPDVPFGGIVVLFKGDFCQTLPVISHGSREQIVGATLCRSRLWQQIQLHHLCTNMRLDQNIKCRQFAEWLLEIDAGYGVNAENEIILPQYNTCVVKMIFNP